MTGVPEAKTPIDLAKDLEKYKDVGTDIYGRKRSAKAYSLQSCKFTVLQLLISGMIDVTVKLNDDENDKQTLTTPTAYCNLKCDDSFNLVMHSDNAWKHMYIIS